MPNQAIAAHGRGAITDPDPLVLTDPEWDTLAWVLSVGHDLSINSTGNADDAMRRSMLAMHAAWVGPVFHTPRFAVDGTVVVERPAAEHCRAVARLLRLLSAAAMPNTHPTGMVFYITARDAADLADRIEAGSVAA